MTDYSVTKRSPDTGHHVANQEGTVLSHEEKPRRWPPRGDPEGTGLSERSPEGAKRVTPLTGNVQSRLIHRQIG